MAAQGSDEENGELGAMLGGGRRKEEAKSGSDASTSDSDEEAPGRERRGHSPGSRRGRRWRRRRSALIVFGVTLAASALLLAALTWSSAASNAAGAAGAASRAGTSSAGAADVAAHTAGDVGRGARSGGGAFGASSALSELSGLPLDEPKKEEDDALTLVDSAMARFAPGIRFEDFQQLAGGARYMDRDLELSEKFAGKRPANLFDVAHNANDPARARAASAAAATVQAGRRSDNLARGPSADVPDASPRNCYLTDAEHCSIGSMSRNDWTSVYPGGQTTCILGKPFFFQVLPGKMDRLMIYFQGGGSCWEEGSAKMRMCTMEPWAQPLEGIFSRNRSLNPYSDYTVLFVGYCSGDTHVGDTARNWTGPRDAPVNQRGYRNARAAVDWALANVGSRELEDFLIAGSSAGSLGAEVWSRTLLKEFRYRRAAVLLDSYVGVFPTGTQGGVISESGVCATTLLSKEMASRCTAGGFDIHDVFSETLEAFPDVAFAQINSKTDAVQIAFHDAIQISLLHDRHLISAAEFSKRLALIEEFHGRHNNYLVFDINSRRHTYFCGPEVLEAEAGGTKLIDWLASFPVGDNMTVTSKCTGVDGTGRTKTGWDFCSPTASSNQYASRRFPRFIPRRR